MLYQLSYQGIGRSIAQGLFRGKGFLCIFRQKLFAGENDLVLAHRHPYCRKSNSETIKREVHQLSWKTNSGAVEYLFARWIGHIADSRRDFQFSAHSGCLDVAAWIDGAVN
jgi:hypothetical protein